MKISQKVGQISRYGDYRTIFQWNENEITIGEPHTSYLENSWDKSNLEFLKTNSIWNLHMLWKDLHHIVREATESSTLGIHPLFCFQISSVTSTGENSWHRDLKTQIRVQAMYLALDIEDIPSMNPGTNPIRIPTNFLPSRKASRRKCHNTQCSKMRSILKLLKEMSGHSHNTWR